MNVSELIEREYNTKTTYNINPEVAKVETTVTKIFSYNPRRLSFTVVNLGDNNIVVAPDSGVTLTRGIFLVKNGGTMNMIWNEDFEMSCFEWYAIADTAACEIFAMEVMTL